MLGLNLRANRLLHALQRTQIGVKVLAPRAVFGARAPPLARHGILGRFERIAQNIRLKQVFS